MVKKGRGRQVAGWDNDDDGELLLGHLKGAGKTILTEAQALLHTEVLQACPGTGRHEDEQELRQCHPHARRTRRP